MSKFIGIISQDFNSKDFFYFSMALFVSTGICILITSDNRVTNDNTQEKKSLKKIFKID